MKNQRLFILALTTVLLLAISLASAAIAAGSLLDDPQAEAAIQQTDQMNKTIAKLSVPQQHKSPGKAFLFSIVVPGTGEFYSGARRGVFLAAAEVALWTTYFVLHGQAEDLKEDYVGYVDKHIVFEKDSPTKSTQNWTLEDYEHATQSDNWHYVYVEGNDTAFSRVGKYYWDDLPEDKINQPGGVELSESQSQARIEAFQKRGATNDRFKQAKIFLGLVVLNHIVSAIDARIAATMSNDRLAGNEIKVSLIPVMSPSGKLGARLALSAKL